jgi:predicted RNA-binding Zn-ribbon protein involved in translation (DUF1610 family)
MAFCSSCGAQAAEGVKFCTSCGKPIAASAPPQQTVQGAPKPAKEKVGNVRTCPSCGGQIGSFEARCPNCGHEFNEARVASGLKEFTEKLQKWSDSDDRDKRGALVKSFPVPNLREELLEFAIMSFTNIKEGGWDLDDNKWQEEDWANKWGQILMKAKLVLAKDPETLAQITEMNNELEQMKAAGGKKARKKKLLNVVVWGIGMPILMLITALVMNAIGIEPLDWILTVVFGVPLLTYVLRLVLGGILL